MTDTVTRTDTLIIDADAHVIETERTWDYLDPSEAQFRPQYIATTSEPKHRYWLVDGHLSGLPSAARFDDFFIESSANAKRNVAVDLKARTMEDIDTRLQHMTELGIDVQVLHSSIWLEQVTNRPDIEVALSKSWNRWLAKIWKKANGRLRWTCVVPTIDVASGLDELRFAKDHGAVGVCLRPYEPGLTITDPHYFPIYQLAEELDLAVIVHIANGDPTLREILDTRYGGTDGFSMLRIPTVLSCYGLLRKSIPSLFPQLRWGFIEASASWVVWIFNELQRRSDHQFTATNNPFVNGNVFVSGQSDDDFEYISSRVGEDVLVIGTDYGHLDPASEVDAISKLKSFDIPESLKHKILTTNPARLYGIS